MDSQKVGPGEMVFPDGAKYEVGPSRHQYRAGPVPPCGCCPCALSVTLQHLCSTSVAPVYPAHYVGRSVLVTHLGYRYKLRSR